MNNERYAVAWCPVSHRYYRLRLAGSAVTAVSETWLPDGRDYWACQPIVPAGCIIPDYQIKPPPLVDAPPPLTDPPALHTIAPLRSCMVCGSRQIAGCDCMRHALPCGTEHRYQCIYCRMLQFVHLSTDR